MNITYKLTLNQYQEAVNFHYKSTKRPLFVAVFVGLATYTILVGTNFSNTQEVINNVLVAFFSISFYLLFTRIVTAYQAKRIYTKSPLLSNEMKLHISGKGIKQNRTNQTKTLAWETFSKWKKNEKYYLIYTSPHQFNIIPMSAMSEKEIEELDAYLEKYITKKIK